MLLGSDYPFDMADPAPVDTVRALGLEDDVEERSWAATPSDSWPGARSMPDERVQAAIDNWAPRMVTQGIDYNDFVRTTARIERWEEWLDAWSETGELHLRLAREAEDAGRRRTAGEAFVRAALCFHFAKYVWVVQPERNRETTIRARDALREAQRLLDPSAERIEAPLDGGAVIGNLRRPAGAERPPLVLLIPGLDSTKEEFFNFERVFLERGLATLSLDGPGQGEAGFELRSAPTTR